MQIEQKLNIDGTQGYNVTGGEAIRMKIGDTLHNICQIPAGWTGTLTVTIKGVLDEVE